MQLMCYLCRTCGTEVADTRTGTLLSCPQHPRAVMDAVIVHDQQGPEMREDEEETRMRAIEYVQSAFYVVLALLAVLVAAQAIATLKDVSQDLCQGQQVHHTMMQAHDQMLTDHQAQMRQLTR